MQIEVVLQQKRPTTDSTGVTPEDIICHTTGRFSVFMSIKDLAIQS